MSDSKLSAITEILNKLLSVLKRYRVIVFIVVLATIYGFLIFSINTMNSQQPTDAEISDQLKSLNSPHIDQSAVDKINQLQDNSVQVKTLFSEARKSPFAECLDKNGKPTQPPHCVN